MTKSNKIIVFLLLISTLSISISSISILSTRQERLIEFKEQLVKAGDIVISSSDDLVKNISFEKYLKNDGISTTPNTIGLKNSHSAYRGIQSRLRHIKSQMSVGINEGNSSTDEFGYLDRFSLKAFSNKVILPILLISCGIFGAVVANLRNSDAQGAKDIFLGTSIGFITYLGIESGSIIFLAHGSNREIMLNHTSLALTSALAGMFSNKFYNAIAKISDKIFAN